MTQISDPADAPRLALRVFEPPALPTDGARVKILLLKLDHIGDFVTAMPAFQILRAGFPDAHITLICLPSLAEMAERTGLFDLVQGFAFVADSVHLGKGQPRIDSGHIAAFKELLDEPYFLAADFKHDPFGRFGLDHVDAHYRAAFSAQSEKGLDIVIPIMEWDAPAASVKAGVNLPPAAGLRLNLLAHAIVETLRAPHYQWRAQPAAQNDAYRQLQSIARFKLGVSLGAGSVLRQWPLDYWIKLLGDIASTRDVHFVFFGGEADRADTQKILAALPPDRVSDLTGAVPLADMAGLMKLCGAYIGCDTGLTHLAASLDLPTLDLFAGISNVSVWHARGAKAKTLYAEAACAPCHKRFRPECPHDTICMKAILPDIVRAHLGQLIAGL